MEHGGPQRKADGEHPEDPEREGGKWMRTEGNKRKTVEERGSEHVEEHCEALEEVGENKGEEESGGRHWK